MNQYSKPMALVNEELAEGVYAASGAGNPQCDSKYMNGIWQKPDYSAPDGVNSGYKVVFGCIGCPANTATGCGLDSHYEDSGQSGSYDVDKGNRKPTWEKKGYGPTDPITDWNM